MKHFERFRTAYRRGREAVTGRVEVEKKIWNRMLADLEVLKEDNAQKDQRIEALVEMVRKAEDKIETVRSETYRNVSAGIIRMERENREMKRKLKQAEYFNITAPGLILEIRKLIRAWMEENGFDPDEAAGTSSEP